MKFHIDRNLFIYDLRLNEAFIAVFHIIDKLGFRFIGNLVLQELPPHIAVEIEYLFSENLEQFSYNAL